MKIPDLYRLSVDIRDLYIKTKNSNVEGLFIKMSQAHNTHLLKWLSSPQGYQDIAPMLSNSNVFETLSVLKQIRQQFPVSVSMSDIFEYFHKNKNPALDTIIAFSHVQSGKAESILSPFKDIIMVCSKFDLPVGVSVGDITQDLGIIHDAFVEFMDAKTAEGEKEYQSTKKLTTKEKKTAMFSGMLQKFSSEVAGAANRAGKVDLADAVNMGYLFKPEELGRYTTIVRLTGYQAKEIQKLVKYVSTIKNLDSSKVDANYNYVKEKLMIGLQMISEKELVDIYSRRMNTVDSSQFMNPEMLSNPKVSQQDMETLNVSDASLLSPRYLTVLCAFLALFHMQTNQ